MSPSPINCVNFYLSARKFNWRAFSKLNPLVTTRCHCSQARRYGCQFANVCELSLSFVWVEPIPPGVAGACALSLLKGRDELFHVAFAYAASFGP